MWLSKLNEMSVGPLWVLRDQPQGSPYDESHQIPDELQARAAQRCPVCGQSWLESGRTESGMLAILEQPLTDGVQKTLLQNCLRSANWHDAACFTLHGACGNSADIVAQALQTELAESAVRTIIIFGETAAQKIDSQLRRGQQVQFHDSRLVVTYHPDQMVATPALKAQVWADLCLATHET